MSPANPRYVGRGDSICGGEVVYAIPEIRQLLGSQPEDAQRWLTTSQMGWALARERNDRKRERRTRRQTGCEATSADDRGMGLRVGFININDMYNNDVGKGGVRGVVKLTSKIKGGAG